MPASPNPSDPSLRKLERIELLLESLLIIETAQAGMTRDQVREMLSVSPARVSAIWKNIKIKQGQ